LTEAALLLRNQARPLDRKADMYAAGIIDLLSLGRQGLAEITSIMRR
jgi:hypothetical protein